MECLGCVVHLNILQKNSPGREVKDWAGAAEHNLVTTVGMPCKVTKLETIGGQQWQIHQYSQHLQLKVTEDTMTP
jgi:hypothetical protein